MQTLPNLKIGSDSLQWISLASSTSVLLQAAKAGVPEADRIHSCELRRRTRLPQSSMSKNAIRRGRQRARGSSKEVGQEGREQVSP